tara:strand:+ start:799 stop:1026 length:228 start_codon:yes stop_codon:yes gene_type:complete
MISANQKYKASNSELPFKEWLKTEQKDGKLLDFSEKKDKTKDRTEIIKSNNKNNNLIHILGLASVGFLFYGLTRN